MIRINLLKPKAIIQKGRWYDQPVHWRGITLRNVFIEASRDRIWIENHNFSEGKTIEI